MVAAVLADPKPHIGRVIELTGPKSQDLHGMAREFSKALNRAISYTDVAPEIFSAALKTLPEHVAQHVVTMAEDQRVTATRAAGRRALHVARVGRRQRQRRPRPPQCRREGDVDRAVAGRVAVGDVCRDRRLPSGPKVQARGQRAHGPIQGFEESHGTPLFDFLSRAGRRVHGLCPGDKQEVFRRWSVVGCWLSVAGRTASIRSAPATHSSLVTRHSSLVTRHSSLVTAFGSHQEP